MVRPTRRSGRATGLAPLAATALVLLVLALSFGPAPAAAGDAANVTAYRGPDAAFGSAGAVEAAIANGTIERAGDDGTVELVVGERLVVAVESERLAGEMAAGNGSATERFLDVLDGGAGFRLVETNPTTMRPPLVASVGRGNVTAYRAGATTYALVDTGNLTVRYGGEGESESIHGGERFAVEFGYDLSDSLYEHDPSDPAVELHPFESRFDATGRWYEPLPPEWVRLSVDVNVAPERSLVARVTLDGNRTVAAPVDPDDVPGLARVWLDLGGVEPGTDYILELVDDGAVVDRYDGTVREPRARLSNATLARAGGGAAVGVTALLSHGGQVRVIDEECEAVGTAWVDPGTETRLSIELWNRRGERIQAGPGSGYGVQVHALRARGAARATYPGSAAVASVGFDSTCGRLPLPRTPPPTPTPTARPTTTSPPATPPGTSPPTVTTPPRPDDGGTEPEPGTGRTGSPGQPGFDAPAALAALAALLALAFLRARRP